MSDDTERPKRRMSRPWETEVSSIEKVWVEGEDDPSEGRLPFDEPVYDEAAVAGPVDEPLDATASGDVPNGETTPAQPLDIERANEEIEVTHEEDADVVESEPLVDEAGHKIRAPGEALSEPLVSPPVLTPDTATPLDSDDGPGDVDDGNHAPRTESEMPEGELSVEDLKTGPTSLDDFTQEDYIAASTREYRDFAEELANASTEQVEQQAVAASIPGVGSGLIGFEDVTGQPSITEEEIEHQEQQAASDLTLRIGTGLVLVGVFLGGLMLGRGWFAGVVCAVMLLSLGEFYTTVRSRGYVPIALFGFIGTFAAGVGTLRGGVQAIGASVALTLALTGLMYGITVRRNPLENAAITLLGMTWVSMLAFAIGIAQAENFVGLILLIVLLTAFNDIGAYFVGRSVGRRQLAPTVSPGKTVEGFIGGTLVVFVLAAILSTFQVVFHVDLTEALLLAGVVAVMGPLGDAAESVVKRALEVKDMGSLLPGHGGMLDRIDGLLFVLPAAYLVLELLGKL